MNRYQILYRSEKSGDIFHEENEDYLMRSRFCLMNDAAVDVMAVADGMGGLEAGAEASRTAVTAFMGSFYQELMRCYLPARPNYSILHYCELAREAVTAAFQAANRAVCETASGTEMGTTLSVAVLLGDYMITANVGDSPIYYYDSEQEELRLAATLQTKAEYEYRQGRYERYSEEYYENDYIITEYLGKYERLPEEAVCYYIEEYIRSGDMLLVCSDGAVGRLMPEEILEILRHEEEPLALRRLFAEAALDGDDDRTAVWMKVS